MIKLTIIRCPRCQQRIVSSMVNTEAEHECFSRSTVLDQEDIKTLGDYSGDLGSGTEPNRSLLRGITNNVWGTIARIEGAKVHSMTERGQVTCLFRQRSHFQEMDFKDKTLFLKKECE